MTNSPETPPTTLHPRGVKSGQKVLFLALSGIGNYLMQSPTIAALKKAHPDWHITVWVAPRGTKALAEADPNVDEVIERPVRNSIIGHLVTCYMLYVARYDIGIVLSPGQLIKSAAYLFLAGIPIRIGEAYNARASNPLSPSANRRRGEGRVRGGFLLTNPVPEQENLHDIEQNLRLLAPLGVEIEKIENRNYSIQIPGNSRKEAEILIQKLQIPTNKTLIGIHAGSAPDLAFKRWSLENFAQVAAELIKNQNAHILLFGGPDEEQQKQELKNKISSSLQEASEALPRLSTLSSRSKGSEAAASTTGAISVISAPLLTTAAIMQYCKLFISSDSGLMHLAAASGVTTYGLFGPTDETKTGPRGPDWHAKPRGASALYGVIRAPGTKPVYNTERNSNLGSQPHPTMKAITPQIVLTNIIKAKH